MQTNNSEIRNSPSVKKHQKGRPLFFAALGRKVISAATHTLTSGILTSTVSLQDKQGDNRLTHLQNGLYSVKVSQNAFALACTTA
jgi:hypothetical protein